MIWGVLVNIFRSEFTDSVFEQASLTNHKMCGVCWQHPVWLTLPYSILFILVFGWFNGGRHTYYTATLRGLQQLGEFTCTMMLTDRPTVPVMF